VCPTSDFLGAENSPLVTWNFFWSSNDFFDFLGTKKKKETSEKLDKGFFWGKKCSPYFYFKSPILPFLDSELGRN
jgi:hypothetical protein